MFSDISKMKFLTKIKRKRKDDMIEFNLSIFVIYFLHFRFYYKMSSIVLSNILKQDNLVTEISCCVLLLDEVQFKVSGMKCILHLAPVPDITR